MQPRLMFYMHIGQKTRIFFDRAKNREKSEQSYSQLNLDSKDSKENLGELRIIWEIRSQI